MNATTRLVTLERIRLAVALVSEILAVVVVAKSLIGGRRGTTMGIPNRQLETRCAATR